MASDERQTFESIERFNAYLNRFVNTSSWGTGSAKSVEDLFHEIKVGDCGLVAEGRGILRITYPLFIDVFYRNGSDKFHCFEKQSKKGIYRNLPGTFAEKMHTNEDMFTAIKRTLEEEVKPSLPGSGLSLNNNQLMYGETWDENTGARSYPGLQTLSRNTKYNLVLAPDQGMPRPFVLQEANGESKFDWEIIS